MISTLFQDLDEAIISSTPLDYVPVELFRSDAVKLVESREKDQAIDHKGNLVFRLESGEIFVTTVRPCAVELFRTYEKMVGAENVYILTTSIREYALTINKMAGFGIPEDQIIAREAIHAHRSSTGYGSGTSSHILWDRRNVLIDNLPMRYNGEKVDMMGITPERYIQTEDYYGNNLGEEKFMSRIIEKLSTYFMSHPS